MFEDTVCSPFPIDNNYYLWLTHTTSTGKVWYITSNKMRTEYQLWNGKRKTARKAIEPSELYRYIKEI